MRKIFFTTQYKKDLKLALKRQFGHDNNRNHHQHIVHYLSDFKRRSALDGAG
jgi:mRNA-degrading endonuclease YafQ of YafQ-DinJ toxin-antitoxin module